MTINKFDLEFFELNKIITEVDEDNLKTLKNTLIKLNNPTYYSKYIVAHPSHSFGYYTSKTLNPVLLAIKSMLDIIKSDLSLTRKQLLLQTEYAWAYNHYIWYSKLSALQN